MRTGFAALGLLLALSGLPGCTTTFSEGAAAARAGRYLDASSAFERALAEDPDRLDALVGLGIARYKLRAFDDAITALERAEGRASRDATVRLYLGLSYLEKGEVGPADGHLTAFVEIAVDRRIAAQAQRALSILRSGPIDAETRAFLAASLDDEADLLRELGETRQALARAEARPRIHTTRLVRRCP
jgi:tetratricopeptide (TPR) repeat protein